MRFSPATLFLALLFASQVAAAQSSHYVDCTSGSDQADGMTPQTAWKTIERSNRFFFEPSDRLLLKRGTSCAGALVPRGSGAEGKPIRITAYGNGPRPRIVAAASDRQVLLLFNQEYWQVDSLDLSGASTYGIFVSGDKGVLHHIALKNLYVHDVRGGEMKNKDNGLVLVGPSGRDMHFEDVLVDGVDAAHTNQWAGILIGGGDFGMDSPLNKHVTVRNSSVHDVYGDGIVLFRDSDGLIETSTAWETGMQPTQTIGTPNAIWTWTCTDCMVRDNEAFLTDSPGVDGGAYDIDWNNTRNTVERNYAHDTQGYCIAVFGAGFITSESVVRDNLCIANGLSPRLAGVGGALNLYTWNGGAIRGLRVEHNKILWSPPVSAAPAIVDSADTGGEPIVFIGNRIESSAPLFYRTDAHFAPAENHYLYSGGTEPRFTIGDKSGAAMNALQAAGFEKGTTLAHEQLPDPTDTALKLEAGVDFALDADGLLAPGPRAELMVLRSLAAQYGGGALEVTVHLCEPANASPKEAAARVNALLDLGAPQIHFVHDGRAAGTIRLSTAGGRLLEQWSGFQNAATLGWAVRKRVGAPRFTGMENRR